MNNTTQPGEIGDWFLERFAEWERKISQNIHSQLKDRKWPITELRIDNARYAIEFGNTEHLVKRRLKRIWWKIVGILSVGWALVFPLKYIKEQVSEINTPHQSVQKQK